MEQWPHLLFARIFYIIIRSRLVLFLSMKITIEAARKLWEKSLLSAVLSPSVL